MKLKKIKAGFTLIEILVIIAITAVTLSFVISFFYKFSKSQALDKDYLSVASIIEQARSSSVNSKLSSQYGVYFSDSSVVLFKGQNYVSNDSSNKIYILNNRVTLSSLGLAGSSTSQIVFDRIDGYANASGTISVYLRDGSVPNRVIRIYKTGIIEY